MSMIFFAQRANLCFNKNNLGLEINLRLAISNRNAVRIFKMCGNHFSEKLIRVNFKVQPKDANDHGCTFPMTTIRGLRGAQGLRGEARVSIISIKTSSRHRLAVGSCQIITQINPSSRKY